MTEASPLIAPIVTLARLLFLLSSPQHLEEKRDCSRSSSAQGTELELSRIYNSCIQKHFLTYIRIKTWYDYKPFRDYWCFHPTWFPWTQKQSKHKEELNQTHGNNSCKWSCFLQAALKQDIYKRYSRCQDPKAKREHINATTPFHYSQCLKEQYIM